MRLLATFLVFAYSTVSHSLIVRKPPQPVLSKNTSDGSSNRGSSHEAAESLRPQCSFIGPTWNPLQDCFPKFGAAEVREAVSHRALCKLKKDLQFHIWSAWSWIDTSNLSRSVGNASVGAKSRHAEKSPKHHDTQSPDHGNNINEFSSNRSYHFEQVPSCAVVSNSGVLRRHKHGAAIDATDLAIRFNDAPLYGWSDIAGRRDNTRIVNNQFPERVLHHSIPSYEFQDHALYGLLTFKDDETFRPPGFHRMQMKYPDSIIRVLPHTLMKSLEKTLRHVYNAEWFHGEGVSFIPTSGSIGMLTALAACDKVLAFGMAATPAASYSPYHYYAEHDTVPPEVTADENGWHKSFNAEKDLWRRIATNPPDEIDYTDIAVIPGFSQVQCS